MRELYARVFLARSNEMKNRKCQRGISKPKQQQHRGSPAGCISNVRIIKVSNYLWHDQKPGKPTECNLQN